MGDDSEVIERPKRKPDTGLVRPYRKQIPADFRAMWIEHGEVPLPSIYRTNYRVIRRWRDEYGHQELADARTAHLLETRWPNGVPSPRAKHSRAAKYAIGRRMGRKTAIASTPEPAPVPAIGTQRIIVRKRSRSPKNRIDADVRDKVMDWDDVNEVDVGELFSTAITRGQEEG